MTKPHYVCDLCGFSTPDQETVFKHLAEEHDIQDPGVVGEISQEGGILRLKHADEDEQLIDLDQWLRKMLYRGDENEDNQSE